MLSDEQHKEINEGEKENLVSTASGVQDKTVASGSEEVDEPATVAGTGHDEAGTANAVQEDVPEKLQDDDQLKEIWYKRYFFKVFPQLRRGVCVYVLFECVVC